MKTIAVTGSLAFDYIMDFPQSFEENILPHKLKTLSVSFLAHNFSKNFGGTAGNIAYNLSLLQQSVVVIASAGKKDFDAYRTHLQGVGADVSKIHIAQEEFSANMFMITDKNNCQIAGFYPGAMQHDTTLTLVKNVDFAIISPTIPAAMDGFVTQAKKQNIPYLFDPAQQIPRLSSTQLKNGIDGATVLVGNDYELAMIEKKTRWSKQEILYKSAIVITTLGAEGSLIEKGGESLNVGIATPKDVVDPTGAGDAYIAGFLTGYMNGKNLTICGQMGAVAAAYAIENYGTQNHIFAIDEFRKRYSQAFGNMLQLQP